MYPTATEDIAYNIPEGKGLEGHLFDGLPVRHVSTSNDVKTLKLEESDNAFSRFNQLVVMYLASSKAGRLTPTKEPAWDLANIGDSRGDRTIPICFSEYRFVDFNFFLVLQARFFKDFPNWRILHVESKDREDLSLAIYPDAISVGSHLSIGEDVQDSLSNWNEKVEERRNILDDSLIKQLTLVESILQSHDIDHWHISTPILLATFRELRDEDQVLSSWFLLDNKDRETGHFIDEWVEEEEWYPIHENGSIGCVYAGSSDTEMWLQHISTPNANNLEVILSSVDENRIFRCHAEDIIEIRGAN